MVCPVCKQSLFKRQAQNTSTASSKGTAGTAGGTTHGQEALRPVALACGHILHSVCADRWLNEPGFEPECPACNSETPLPVLAIYLDLCEDDTEHASENYIDKQSEHKPKVTYQDLVTNLNNLCIAKQQQSLHPHAIGGSSQTSSAGGDISIEKVANDVATLMAEYQYAIEFIKAKNKNISSQKNMTYNMLKKKEAEVKWLLARITEKNATLRDLNHGRLPFDPTYKGKFKKRT
ncbi:hypothetical protein GGI07_004146 [Coemansia sp. Benny D115]|nr:hypothetical protein GGI07_004146 [Coemansia sp. Benny D115]